MTKNETIGLLDSGVGGLSVLAQFYKVMPNQNYAFFADTKNLPYGTKTRDEIYNFTKNILNFFLSKGIKTVVFACNTTSAIAYERLRDYFKDEIKIFPLIQTIIPYSIENLSDGDTIAILATKATINSHKYRDEIKKLNNKINVVEIDCTGFVEIVEQRLYDDEKSFNLIKEKIDIAKKNNAKKVVLGCTHYPYLIDIFKKIYDVEYFNPAKSLVDVVKEEIKGEISQNKETKNPKIDFYVSKDPDEFIKSAKPFFKVDIKDVHLV